jgi:hypothetical protein
MKTGDIFSIEKTLYVRRCGIGRIELRKRGRYGEDGLLHRCKGTEMSYKISQEEFRLNYRYILTIKIA